MKRSLDTTTAWVALSRVRHLAAADALAAAEELGGVVALVQHPDEAAAAIHEAACSRLGRLEGVDAPLTPSARSLRVDLGAAAAAVAATARMGARIVSIADASYPPLLRHIPDAPLVLYVKGELDGTDDLTCAVVGSRNATRYGLGVVGPLVTDLVRAGCTIVSGMARGLDAAAHEAALRAGGRTVAVLGTGIDRPYPISSRPLYRRISEVGAVVSEYAPGVGVRSEQFLARNRIIAGMSRGLLVIEAGARSGTANTVSHALGYDRPVYAVPGDVTTRRSAGTNRLLVDEIARPVRSGRDLLVDLLGPSWADEAAASPRLDGLSRQEKRVWRSLDDEQHSADHIATDAGMQLEEVRAILTWLEVSGLARRTNAGMYVRAG